MSPIEKLQQVYNKIDWYEKESSSLSTRLKAAKEEKLKEEILQKKLKLELCLKMASIHENENEIARLEKERARLKENIHDSKSLLKSFRIAYQINRLKFDAKARSMEKLQTKLETLDFAFEEKDL